MSVYDSRTPGHRAEAPGAEDIDVPAFAASYLGDPRIGLAAPGFDAPFFQAGLAGYSDGAMRRVARASGSPFCVTEAILDRALFEPRWKLDLDDLLATDRADLPLGVQLMGSDPAEMARAGARVAELAEARLGKAGAAGILIDVNLACPVKKVARKRRGGHWLAEPEGAIRLLRALREALPASVQTTVKLRRGSDDSPEASASFLRVFEASYELGYAWTTVHARSVAQAYRGPSRWDFLRQLCRRYPDRLIFGSGDIWSADDIFRMLAWTGVQAVSVARGSIGRPWIFRQARALLAGQAATLPSLAEQRQLLAHHVSLAIACHGERQGSLRMRKIAAQYCQLHPEARDLRAEMLQVADAAGWARVLSRWYPEPEADPDDAIARARAGSAESQTARERDRSREMDLLSRTQV